MTTIFSVQVDLHAAKRWFSPWALAQYGLVGSFHRFHHSALSSNPMRFSSSLIVTQDHPYSAKQRFQGHSRYLSCKIDCHITILLSILFQHLQCRPLSCPSRAIRCTCIYPALHFSWSLLYQEDYTRFLDLTSMNA